MSLGPRLVVPKAPLLRSKTTGFSFSKVIPGSSVMCPVFATASETLGSALSGETGFRDQFCKEQHRFRFLESHRLRFEKT